MNSNPSTSWNGSAPHTSPSELIRTHSEMLAAEAAANAAKRRSELEELCSDLNTPEQRVRGWERVHGLTLPHDPNHRILLAIALKTRLTLEQVQAVQRLYAERRSARTAR